MAVISKRSSKYVTPLDYIADLFKNAGNKFNEMGDSVDNVFILGDWLSSPFKYIGGWLKFGEGKAREANRLLKDSLEWIYTVIDGYGFIDLLNWSSIWFKWLREDRRLFIRTLLTGYLQEGFLFIDNPSLWVRNRILYYASWFIMFLNDPSNFIIGKIVLRFGWFILWLNNPIVRTIEWLKSYNFRLGDFFINPVSFIINVIFVQWFWFRDFVINPSNFIISRIRLYSPFLSDLIMLKERFIYELVRRVLGLPTSFITNPIGTILDYLFLKIDSVLDLYLERIKQLVIRIILKFI